ncbi:hypothetical protein [Kangiella marina]|uniref:DUF4386 domain-containing protein n=1 Tax=Kangiella marina TaxID=1079178 RepID=A0ABP8IKC6_9GAMM
MKRDYLLPGIASIVLAILFPVYWALLIYSRLDSAHPLTIFEPKLDGYSGLFLLIGAISVYLYIYFKKILHEQLNFKSIDVLLTLIIINSVIFFGGIFLSDVLANFGLAEAWTTTGVHILSISCMIIFGILDVIIGIILLANYRNIPAYLSILAAISILLGLFEVSVSFSAATIVIYPLYLVFLSIYFLRKPETIEVV